MSKLTRGNVLATIKKLKKMPRPKASVSAPAVQAICGQKTANKSNKVADLKATMERRRAMLSKATIVASSRVNSKELKHFEDEFSAFMTAYRTDKLNESEDMLLDLDGCIGGEEL